MIVCGGSASAGKSLACELKIKKYVHDGVLPSWVLDIQEFLKNLGLTFVISCNQNKCKASFNILNVPEEKRNTIFEKTKELGLLFIVHQKQRAMYDKHPLYYRESKIIGFQNTGICFEIREPKSNENINKICHTFERELI